MDEERDADGWFTFEHPDLPAYAFPRPSVPEMCDVVVHRVPSFLGGHREQDRAAFRLPPLGGEGRGGGGSSS